MISEDKWAANIANAQKSTGPRTPEGKARASQNARTHGLTAKDLSVLPEQKEEFDELRDELIDEIKPSGALEWTLLEQLVRAAWDLRRIGRMEFDQTRHGPESLDDPQRKAEIDRLFRYKARAERSYHRAYREIRALQTDLAQRYFVGDPALFGLPRTVDTAKLVKLTKRSQPGGDQQAAFNRMLDAVLNAPMPSIDESPFRTFRTPQKEIDPTQK